MTDIEISKSFDDLIENMDKLLPELNRRGSELIKNQQYQEAKEIILEAEKVMSLQNKLIVLKEEWLGLELPLDITTPSSEDDQEKLSREAEKYFRSQSHTSSKEFRIPILQALVNLGGGSKRNFVFDELEKIMGDQLSENDWEPLPSRNKLARWQRIVANTRTKMRNEGYITVDPTKGLWIITEKGRALLNTSEEVED